MFPKIGLKVQGSTQWVVICDSRRDFQFSWLSSLLSLVCSGQHKKIKINEIINKYVTLKKYENYDNTLDTELLIVLICLALIRSILFTIKPTNFKKSFSRIFEEKIKPQLVSLIYELILIPFCPFDIKYKKT